MNRTVLKKHNGQQQLSAYPAYGAVHHAFTGYAREAALLQKAGNELLQPRNEAVANILRLAKTI